MPIGEFLVGGETVVQEFRGLHVMREKVSKSASRGWTAYVTNQRVIFLKRSRGRGFEMHEIRLQSITGTTSVSRRIMELLALGVGALILGASLQFSVIGPMLGNIPMYIVAAGMLALLLWLMVRRGAIVIYGEGQPGIVVTKGNIVSLLKTIREQQAGAIESL
ncbi:MAG: hypothetical protein ACTSXX_02840 [Candidatus Baldrarchaeia archaeon]